MVARCLFPWRDGRRQEKMMHDNRPSHVDLSQISHWLIIYRWRWILPTVIVAAAAAAFALLKPAEWDASQALTIRDEATNNDDGPGKFGHSDERRTAQETVLELAKSHAVLAPALQAVGPPAHWREPTSPWPSEMEVEEFRENVTLTPPKGAELGRTEVFYLTVRDRDRRRAVALVDAVRDQLEHGYRQLRDATARSMSTELRRAVEVARGNLDEATDGLAAMEAAVGEDLGDLRMLYESLNGETSLQRTANLLRDELRQISNTSRSTEELIGLLREAQQDPQRLVVTPNRLLEAQPGLRRLKEGLLDAQLRTAGLLGRMSPVHPMVAAAREAEQEVRQNIHAELADAIKGLQLELRLQNQQGESLHARIQQLDLRLNRLAEIRARYGAQLAESASRIELLRLAEDDLAQAEASQIGADAASLIGRIDVATAGTRPVGPGRTLIVLVGLVGGLLTGLGLLVLTVPMPGAQWDTSETEPEVVVVFDSTDNRQELPVREDWPGHERPAPVQRRAEDLSLPGRASAQPSSPRTIMPDLRMPEHDYLQAVTPVMTLKEALQRVGST